MKNRLSFDEVLPEGYDIILQLDQYSSNSGLEPELLELVKLRASQINGCAYCIDMHSKDARTRGESEQRLYGLTGWRETPFYTERERAALEFTEAVTLIANNHVSGEVYEKAQQHFSNEELAKLMIAIITINAWNRISVTFKSYLPGSYKPDHFVAVKKGTS